MWRQPQAVAVALLAAAVVVAVTKICACNNVPLYCDNNDHVPNDDDDDDLD